ncbi:MAG TPA: hypothetical protein VH372_02135 [Actinospica sp.]|jgi:hypothetical protein|nr:hypothetical protein [Actinospica sp.]
MDEQQAAGGELIPASAAAAKTTAGEVTDATVTALPDATVTALADATAVAAASAGAAVPLQRPTLHGEFARVVRTRPDWLYGLLCSWGFGYGFLAYIVLFTHPDLTHDPMPTAVLVVLSAIADGSLTNQLAAEPEWAAALLRGGEDPGRILRVRNLMLVLCELFFVCTVVALIARLGHSDAWIPRALPELAVLPLAPIAIGNLTSVLVPTPFMRLSCRFQAPGTWVRWAIYVTIPFVLSSLSLALYWLPSRVEAHYEPRVLERVGSFKHLTVTLASATHVYVTIWLVLIPLWQLVIWLFSLRLADSLARMRRHGLARLMDRHAELAGSLPPLSLYQSTRQLPVRCREIPTDLRAELRLIGSELLEASTTFSRL